jgi:CheY-like chemotaxis protein
MTTSSTGVLVVYDYAEARDYIGILLEPKGLGPTYYAADAQNAILLLQNHGKAIRLVTLNLSHSSSIDVWRVLDFLRETRVDPIAVVMTTDESSEENQKRFEAYESPFVYAVRMLAKPLEPPAFCMALDQAIRALDDGRVAAAPMRTMQHWIAEILERENGDAAHKTKEGWYWGDAGRCVGKAVFRAKSAMASVAVDHDLNAYLERLDAALAAALQKYRADDEDPDGFGAATFHGIRRDVKALHARLPPRKGKRE